MRRVGVAAPGVVAPVRALARGTAWAGAVRGAELDPVEPRGRARGRRQLVVAADDLLDLVRAERARLDLEALARHGRRGHGGSPRRRRSICSRPPWKSWTNSRAAGGVHGLGDACEALHAPRVVARRSCVPVSRPLGCTAVASMQISPAPPSCARRVVGHEVVGRQAILDQRRLVRGRDDPVADLDRPDPQGAEEQRVGHRCRGYGEPLTPRARRAWLGRWLRSRASCASAAVTILGIEGSAGLVLERLSEGFAGENLGELHVGRRAGDDAALDRDVLAAEAEG